MNDVKSGFAVASITALAIAAFASLSLPCHAQGEEENQALFVTAKEKRVDPKVARVEPTVKYAPKERGTSAPAEKDARFEDFRKQLTRESG
ncbi:MAG TPA: hypothetical protein VFP36_09405, partial [Usitatibacter sp.]|nr:hypothetical protein [Usitatibacter sp.]